VGFAMLLIAFSLPIAGWGYGTPCSTERGQMRVGDISKFAKSLIFGSDCDLNMHGVPGNRPLVRVSLDGKGSHLLGKLLNFMGLSELYTMAF
jgi:hypothetical protein